MRVAAALALFLLLACTGTGSAPPAASTPATILPSTPSTSGAPAAAIQVPPAGSETVRGSCGSTQIYKGGSLPDWAYVNAPKFLPYVVARPGIALGYLFSYPLTSGPKGNKILWYVATPREGYPLVAEGHPLGATTPIATFNRPADSSPGEIYPSGPTVPSADCWHFTLQWLGGSQRAEVDRRFL